MIKRRCLVGGVSPTTVFRQKKWGVYAKWIEKSSVFHTQTKSNSGPKSWECWYMTLQYLRVVLCILRPERYFMYHRSYIHMFMCIINACVPGGLSMWRCAATSCSSFARERSFASSWMNRSALRRVLCFWSYAQPPLPRAGGGEERFNFLFCLVCFCHEVRTQCNIVLWWKLSLLSLKDPVCYAHHARSIFFANTLFPVTKPLLTDYGSVNPPLVLSNLFKSSLLIDVFDE